MNRYYFENCQELAAYMADKAQDGFYTVAALFYKEANELLRELLLYEDIEAEAIILEPSEYSGYEKEYYISLADDMILSVEPAYVDGHYLNACADLLLVDAEANYKIVADEDDRKCREIYIGENYPCNYDCADCEYYETDSECDECDDCNECEDEVDYIMDRFFDSATISKNEDGEAVISLNIEPIIEYLFS